MFWSCVSWEGSPCPGDHPTTQQRSVGSACRAQGPRAPGGWAGSARGADHHVPRDAKPRVSVASCAVEGPQGLAHCSLLSFLEDTPVLLDQTSEITVTPAPSQSHPAWALQESARPDRLFPGAVGLSGLYQTTDASRPGQNWKTQGSCTSRSAGIGAAAPRGLGRALLAPAVASFQTPGVPLLCPGCFPWTDFHPGPQGQKVVMAEAWDSSN